MVSVHCALRTAGFLKSGTALLTASTPVIAEQPLANALINSHALTDPAVSGIPGGETSGCGCPPLEIVCITPSAITPPRQRRKAITGNANASPDSRTPRRLTIVSTASTSRHKVSV